MSLFCLLTLPDGSSQVSATAGGPARPVAGLRDDDRRIAWSRDSRSIFVQRGLDVPAVVERLDLETRQRRVVRELSPEGVSAVMLSVAGWVDDGRWYAYNYTMLPSTLFVVSNGR